MEYFTTERIDDYSKIIFKEDALEDVEAFFFLVKNTYVAYEFMGGDEAFLGAKENIIREINEYEEDLTLKAFNQILTSNLYFVEDKHFAIGELGTNLLEVVDGKAIYNTKSDLGKILYSSDGLILEKDYVGYYQKDILSKKYLKAINGDEDIEKYIYPTISETGEIKYIISILDNRYLEKLDVDVDFKNSFGWESKKKVELVLPFPSQRKRIDEEVTTEEVDGKFVITIPNFVNENPEKFYNTVKEAKNYNDVIIDTRGNIGGASTGIKPWIEEFTEASFFNNYFVSEVLTMDTINLQIGFEDGWDYYLKESYNHNLVPNGKNIYIVYDSRVASAGEDLLQSFKQVENVVLIGTNSAGCSIAGNLSLYKLPNSQLPCQWGPSMWLNAPYFSPEGTGIIPNIVVPNTDDALDLTLKMIGYYEVE